MTSQTDFVKVFVVVIRHRTLHGSALIGSVYWNELEAEREVDRLNKANTYNSAHYVTRTLPYPDFLD